MKRVRPVPAGSFRLASGEISGAAADLGVFVPLAAALVLVNGLQVSAIMVSAGLLILGAGGFFQLPFPVQPLKALTAVAVAAQVEPGVIQAAGLEIGLFLLLLSVSGVAERLARVFEKPVVRSLQFGVGLLLIHASAKMLVHPPEVFGATQATRWLILLAVVSFAGIMLAAHFRRYAVLAAALGIGLATSVVAANRGFPGVSVDLPAFGLPVWRDFSTAFFLLVIPQIPLTFGNAVVAVTDVAHQYFGPRAHRVTPRRVCLSAALGNLFSGLAGGMPMCHGAGGLTAHYRLGARRASMNVLLGGAMLAGGLLFAPHLLSYFALFPVWALSALLAFAGLRHALLAFDLKGHALALALVAGLAGAYSGNLALTTAIALIAHHAPRLPARLQAARGSATS